MKKQLSTINYLCMKKILHVIITIAIVLSMSSCAIHSGLTGNLNNHATNVVLQGSNYKIIQKVKGKATGMYVLGIFGGSFNAKVEEARSNMLASANLIGKPRAIINETVEVNYKYFIVFGLRTITVSAYVIEFTGETNAEVNKAGNTPIPTETSLKDTESTIKEEIIEERETVIENIPIYGKWITQEGDIELTIDGDVAFFSKINFGSWLTSLEKGKANIGALKFKDISKIEKMTWGCQELFPSSKWQFAILALNNTGDVLKVRNDKGTYVLSRVTE